MKPLFSLLIGMMIALPAAGQTGIEGYTVFGGSEAPAPGIVLEVRHTGTGQIVEVVSDVNGRYAVFGLMEGRYEVKVVESPYTVLRNETQIVEVEADRVVSAAPVVVSPAGGVVVSGPGADERNKQGPGASCGHAEYYGPTLKSGSIAWLMRAPICVNTDPVSLKVSSLSGEVFVDDASAEIIGLAPAFSLPQGSQFSQVAPKSPQSGKDGRSFTLSFSAAYDLPEGSQPTLWLYYIPKGGSDDIFEVAVAEVDGGAVPTRVTPGYLELPRPVDLEAIKYHIPCLGGSPPVIGSPGLESDRHSTIRTSRGAGGR